MADGQLRLPSRGQAIRRGFVPSWESLALCSQLTWLALGFLREWQLLCIALACSQFFQIFLSVTWPEGKMRGQIWAMISKGKRGTGRPC